MPDVKLVLATSVKDKGGTVSEDIKDPFFLSRTNPQYFSNYDLGMLRDIVVILYVLYCKTQ